MRKLVGLLLASCVFGLNVASAAADSASLAQTYNSDPSVLAGMMVELKAKGTSTVVPISNKDISKFLGVVVPVSSSPLVLTSTTGTSQQVLVSSSGVYNMLVSNQAGSIKAGDYLTVSALDGIGMKASTAQPQVVGQAASSFDGSNALGSVPLNKSSGGKATVAIGSIQVSLHLSSNPLYQKAATTEVPGFLAKTANSIVNKQVNAARIYLGVLVILAAIVITGGMLYSGVRGSMIAVGRNPLSRKVIGRSLLQVIFVSLIIFVGGVSIAYLVLKL